MKNLTQYIKLLNYTSFKPGFRALFTELSNEARDYKNAMKLEPQDGGLSLPLIGYEEAAAMAGISTKTLRKRIKAGLFPAPTIFGQFNLFRRADINFWAADPATYKERLAT